MYLRKNRQRNQIKVDGIFIATLELHPLHSGEHFIKKMDPYIIFLLDVFKEGKFPHISFQKKQCCLLFSNVSP